MPEKRFNYTLPSVGLRKCFRKFSCYFIRHFLSLFFISCFALLIGIVLISSLYAMEVKPKPEEWEIQGIVAALKNDSLLEVQIEAAKQLQKYQFEHPTKILKNSRSYSENYEILNQLLTQLSKSKNEGARNEALQGLKSLQATQNQQQQISVSSQELNRYRNNLKDPDPNIRADAAYTLGYLKAKEYTAEVARLLKDSDSNVRDNAATALGEIGAKQYASTLVDLLPSIDSISTSFPHSRSPIPQALGAMNASAQAPKIAQLLNSPKIATQVVAIQSLGAIGAKQYAERIAAFLTAKQDNVRQIAAQELGMMQDRTYARQVAPLLETSQPLNVRTAAVEALGKMQAIEYAAQIAKYLNLPSSNNLNTDIPNIRIRALEALGEMKANNHALAVASLLSDLDARVQETAIKVLPKLGPLGKAEVVRALDAVWVYPAKVGKLRFLSHFLGGGDKDIELLMRWLGDSKNEPPQLSYEEGIAVLEAFKQVWSLTEFTPRLRNELESKVATVVSAKKVPWQSKDLSLLELHYNNLKQVNSTQAESLQATIKGLKSQNWLSIAWQTILAHFFFWMALIFAYPNSPQVQAIFFWNPWVRRIGGAGYVGFLLAWVPFLRRKLFEPFRDSLLADAKLQGFNPNAYFPDSEVTLKGTDQTQPIQTIFPEIKGQSILEGDSGLGKTLFLRHLVKASKRLVVYLPAQKCEKGVIEAIQAKLHGQAQDADFLKNLIYSGAIDICIDGLNEVSSDTRATITQFVESYFKGNILMTTQSIEWSPPATAKTYVLQPLRPDQITTFLVLRQTVIPASETYEQDCDRYLQSILNPNQPVEERIAAQRILSNPMDLTIVAQMLAQGRTPDLFCLQEQQYNLMANEYRQIYSSEFPLKPFSEAVYQRRLDDEPALPADEFYNELICMEDDKHKMVISRQWKDTKGEIHKEWYFRHDKIAEFFIVQTFLGNTEAAQTRTYQHLGDPRFRGVYFLLATFLPIDAAQTLREALIQYAANTKDHTVSDTFVQLLRTRKV